MHTTVYLCRHGAYENPRNVFHGRLPGFPLSKVGREQAERLARVFSTKPIATIYASPLRRAFDTARIIAEPHHLKVVADKRLLDIRSPTQGKPIAFLESINWNQYRPEFIAAGGERLSEVYKRMHDFLEEKLLRHSGEQFIVVSHGDPIMTLKVKFLGGRLSLSSIRERYGYIGVGQSLELIFDERGSFRRLGEIR